MAEKAERARPSKGRRPQLEPRPPYQRLPLLGVDMQLSVTDTTSFQKLHNGY